MQHKSIKTHHSGFTIVEIVLGIAMVTMFLVTNSIYFKKLLDVSQETTRSIQSGFLLEEGVEALKTMRDGGWFANIETITPETTYYFNWTGATWEATTTPEIVETVFTRSFVLSNVNRDGSDNIVTAGGALDSGTKKAVVRVEWTSKANRATSTKSVETYLVDIFGN